VTVAVEPDDRTWTLEGGLRLASTVRGPADGPPVLLIHGGGQTRHSWGGTAAALAAAGWWTVAYDQRGHGDSDRPADADYRTTRFARDCAQMCELVARERGRRPVVVGASLGGLAGLLAEGELAPGRAAALVLVDITPRMERAGVDRIVGFMLEHVESGFGSLEEAADAVAAYQPHRPRPRDHTGLAKNLRLDPDGRWRWHWDPRLFLGERPLGTGMLGDRFDAAARRLEVPTLLVRGRMSDLVSEDTARHFLELCPHASFRDVSGAGHMVAGDRNDAFTEAVRSFLRTVEPLV
jgi:pimeloyl-ACP methyl ester carboxylesterase